MSFLLDVNVLIALIDPMHLQHELAHAWFSTHGKKSWATCPLTENGVLRIVGNPRYPNSPGNPAEVVNIIANLCALPGHQFWPDNISLLTNSQIDTLHLRNPAQITDTYLLALASTYQGQLATFDKRLITDAVWSGKKSLHLID